MVYQNKQITMNMSLLSKKKLIWTIMEKNKMITEEPKNLAMIFKKKF